MNVTRKKNYGFIDAQNLNLATIRSVVPWKVDLVRFRAYLRDKYQLDEVYYFIGAHDYRHEEMYHDIQRHGFIVVFREHGINLKGSKKGNVDVDIVFQTMRILYEDGDCGKMLIVSGDGDYKRMVDYLISKDKFLKILIPCREYGSSLYKSLGSEYFDYLDKPDMRLKLGLLSRK